MESIVEKHQGKKAVVKSVEGDQVIFESEGQIVKIPIADVGIDLKDLIEKYRNWPGVLPGTEVEIGPTRCSYHWHMNDCWAAYTTYL
jgi:hypothetical protein